jgi:hypothetical protein
MYTLTTLRALAKRCGRGSNPDDVETYARADLLKLFQERTEIARLFGEPEERVSKALEKIEADGKLDDLGFMTIGTIKSRLEKAKKEKGDASKIATGIAARAFLDAPSRRTLQALCDAGDFSLAGFLFNRKTIGAIVKQIDRDVEVRIDRSGCFSIVVQGRKLRYRFVPSSDRGPACDLDAI